MKAIKLVFGLMMVMALISGPSVVAQQVDTPMAGTGYYLEESDPYAGITVDLPQDVPQGTLDAPLGDNYYAVRDGEGNIEYILIEDAPERVSEPSPDAMPLMPELIGPPSDPPPAEKQADPPEDVFNDTGRVVQPVSGLINIATSAIWEYNPDVAHGGNYYMVVYVAGGHIYAKVYNNSGGLLNTFTVDDWKNNFNVPKIAYNANRGLFLVAYHLLDGSDYDIWYTAVSPTSGQVGDFYGIVTADHETYPVVACNQYSYTCLLAYDRNGSSVLGRYVTLGTGGISSTTGSYNLTNTTGKIPYIDWGKGAGLYLVAYTWTDGSAVEFPVFSHVSDTNTGSDPYTHGGAFAGNFSGWINNKWATGVAYDPCSQKFILLFDHNWSASDVDVRYSIIHKTSGFYYGMPRIAYTTNEERSGDISFITDDNLPAFCGNMDKLVVTYTNWTNKRILATDLRGNNHLSNPIYSVDPESRHYIAHAFATNVDPFWRPAISSGASGANMFLAYNSKATSPTVYNVFGRIIKSPAQTFIPALFR